jgi:hypothetical protein
MTARIRNEQLLKTLQRYTPDKQEQNVGIWLFTQNKTIFKQSVSDVTTLWSQGPPEVQNVNILLPNYFLASFCRLHLLEDRMWERAVC